MIEDPRDPKRFTDAEERSAEIRAEQAESLRTFEREMDQSCAAIERVADSLQADADEADQYFQEK